MAQIFLRHDPGLLSTLTSTASCCVITLAMSLFLSGKYTTTGANLLGTVPTKICDKDGILLLVFFFFFFPPGVHTTRDHVHHYHRFCFRGTFDAKSSLSTMNKPVECKKQCRRDAAVEVTNNYRTRQVGPVYEHVIQLHHTWEHCRENPERLRDTIATITISDGSE